MKEENLALRVWAKKRRRIQEILRSNQHGTKDRIESQAIPRFIVWKDGLIMMPLTKMEKKEENGVFDVHDQAASLHRNVIFRSINLHQLYKNLLCMYN